MHVWAGISMQGRTEICIFEGMQGLWCKEHYITLTGMMDAQVYVSILEHTLQPFVEGVYPDGRRFMQDNSPKHASKLGQAFLEQNNNW